jgi:formate C-acetyltransferase
VEPCSNGRHYGHSGALLVNLTSALELALYNGRHRHTGPDRLISIETDDPRSFTSFGQFRAAFEQQTRWLADSAVAVNNDLGRTHQRWYPTPILSALFEGPMEKGKDLIEGGAVINSSGVAIIGLADVADSLAAIQQVVFEEKSVTFAQLLEALHHDFENHEALRARLMNPSRTPKYGNESPAADAIVRWIAETLDGVFSGKQNYRGGRYRVGYWTMTNHAGFGRLTGALPSGRKARESFASGITPVSGVTPYLSQTLNSVARVPCVCVANGMALNIKYTPEIAGEGAADLMVDTFMHSVQAYFAEDAGLGGMEIQFNIISHGDLLEARDHPERHPELLVRVSGYTAYFKDLNDQMKSELINRTEYSLSKGTAVPFAPIPPPGEGS